jgi:hypothetical protein
MWVIWECEERKEKQWLCYNMGMKNGCLILLTSTILSNLKVAKWLIKSINFEKLLNYFKIVLIVICLCACALFMHVNQFFIILLAVVIGIADGIYTNFILPQLINANPVFESCMELVGTLEKMVILCPMPFFILIVLRMDDVKYCLVCIYFGVSAFLIVSLILRDK